MKKIGRTTITGLGAVALLGAVAAYTLVPAGPRPADGELPTGTSVAVDADLPALRGLDPALLAAVRAAAADARARGVDLRITSGWRSPAYQQRLLDDAVTRYGTLDLARRYVNTPERSTHVSGRAVDVGPTDAADWLGRNGARYGLCQVYANEMWHFELLTAPGGTCPEQLPDAAG
ncbi:M15 family metallopeptidase [Kitasatospora sp. NPDC057198]|uniref:M15 family metallopeptidase n=1 Tax=Kitasatospora sp. NPDC057198 TaxID=3346046 RepID=UPI00362CC07D